MFKLDQLQGAGIALRHCHFNEFMSSQIPVPWLEVLADQYLGSQGVLLDKLTAISKQYVCALHAVSLSIGGCDPINQLYLEQLKELANCVNAVCVSDHLCWSTIDGQYSHDLLPLIYSKQLADYIIDRVNLVQDYLQKPFLLENISHYINHPDNYLLEPSMLNVICEKTGCGILLDVNNIYVSSTNMNMDPVDYVKKINPKFVKQYHLAGFTSTNERLIDTHGAAIDDKVWDFFIEAIKYIGVRPACIEWDNDIPELSVLLAEAKKAEALMCDNNNGKIFFEDNYMLPSRSESLYDLQQSLWQAINSESVDIKSAEQVHQNSMRIQRLSAIMQIYPCCKKILGENIFHQAALKFIDDYPSVSPDITENTKDFSQYVSFKECPFLVDLAEYERVWYDVFHSAGHGDVDLGQLSKQVTNQGEQIALQLTLGLRLVSASYPVLSVWDFCQEEFSGEVSGFCLGDYCYALHQRQGCVITTELTFAQYRSLALMCDSILLDAWCDLCAEVKGFNPSFIGEFYAKGLIVVTEKEGCLL